MKRPPETTTTPVFPAGTPDNTRDDIIPPFRNTAPDAVVIAFHFQEGSPMRPSLGYATPGSAAIDLAADISHKTEILVGDWTLIPTGIVAAIPHGLCGQITIRSGLAKNFGMLIPNSPGIVDSDYRGIIGVILMNHGHATFVVNPGDRIAQMLIIPVIIARWEMTEDELPTTERGVGGFGSTGRA